MHRYESDLTSKEKRQIEIEKLKNLSFTGKLEHMWAYHKIILASPVLLVLLIVFINSMIQNSRMEDVLNIAITGGFQTEVEALTEKTREKLYIENSFSRITIDTNYVTIDGEFDMNSAQKFAVLVAGQGIDILISNPSIYSIHIEHGAFMDLREIFSDEDLEGVNLIDNEAIDITNYLTVREKLNLPYDTVYFMVIANVNIDEVNHDGMTRKELIRNFYKYVIAGM
jgi:hypothetical protein